MSDVYRTNKLGVKMKFIGPLNHTPISSFASQPRTRAGIITSRRMRKGNARSSTPNYYHPFTTNKTPHTPRILLPPHAIDKRDIPPLSSHDHCKHYSHPAASSRARVCPMSSWRVYGARVHRRRARGVLAVRARVRVRQWDQPCAVPGGGRMVRRGHDRV